MNLSKYSLIRANSFSVKDLFILFSIPVAIGVLTSILIAFSYYEPNYMQNSAGWRVAFASWAVVCCVIILPLLIHIMKKSSDLFAPPLFVLGFAFFDLVMRGAVLLVTPEKFKFPYLLPDEELWFALALSFLYGFVAYLFFLIGYYIRFSQQRTIVLRNPSQAYIQIIVAITVFLFISAYFAYLIFSSGLGGLTGLLHSIHKRIEILEGHHYMLALIRWAYIAPMLFFIVLNFKGGSRTKQWFFVGLTVLGCLIIASFGGRGRALMPLLMLAVLWHYQVKPFRLRTLLLLVLLLIVVSKAMLAIRLSSRYDYSLKELPAKMLERGSLTSFGDIAEYVVNDFTALDGMAILVSKMPDELSWQGASLPVSALAVVVPRSWWSKKPTGNAGTIFSDRWLPGNRSAKSTGPVGTAYMIFHLPAVIFFFFLNGIIMRFLYMTFMANRRRIMFVLAYVMILVSSTHLTIPPYENFFIHIIPLLLISFIAKILVNSYTVLST